LLAENMLLQAGKGAENTKEKSRQCFMCAQTPHYRVKIIVLVLCGLYDFHMTLLHSPNALQRL
jgi:hypothetical protein